MFNVTGGRLMVSSEGPDLPGLYIRIQLKQLSTFLNADTSCTGFHTGFLAGGGGGNTDSTCVGMHEMMFTRKHYTDILDNNILLP